MPLVVWRGTYVSMQRAGREVIAPYCGRGCYCTRVNPHYELNCSQYWLLCVHVYGHSAAQVCASVRGRPQLPVTATSQGLASLDKARG